MGVAIRDGSNVLRTARGVAKRDDGNVLRTIKTIKKRDAGNVLRTVWQSMTAAASPSSVSGVVSSSVAAPVTTDSTKATPSGGAGPFTYAWAAVGGNTWTINNPAADTTSFTSPAISPGASESASFVCTITDATGATAATNIVTATASNIGSEPSSGGGLTP